MGLAILWVQQALISAYEDNCPLRPVKTGRYSLKWTSELVSLRKGVRCLFNKCRIDRNLQSWELYREAQWSFMKEVRKASKDAWRTFCSSINDLPLTARLHRALSRDHKIKLVSLVAPSGRHTPSEGETLDLLLATHFPNSWLQGWRWPLLLPTVPNVWTGGWLRGLSPMGEWYGQLIHLPHTKVQEWMGYSWPCCKRDGGSLSLTWSRLFMPVWQLAIFQPYGARLR